MDTKSTKPSSMPTVQIPHLDEASKKRFWSKVDKTESCWNWIAAKDFDGYGVFRISNPRQQRKAHRISYELLVGIIKQGLGLDHLCRNKGCVNPSHLEPVTSAMNGIRGYGITTINFNKTHCKRGHEFTEKNTKKITVRKFVFRSYGRSCKACTNLRARLKRKGIKL